MARDQYQTVKKVADRLKVGEATVGGRVKDGEPRAMEVGKGLRISDSDLEAFLCSHATREREVSAQEAGSDRDGETGRERGT